jgi:hypothetical protein
MPSVHAGLIRPRPCPCTHTGATGANTSWQKLIAQGPAAAWREQARTKIAAMDALIAQGQGDTLVPGGGCTEPGGGIVPTTHTARDTAAILRQAVAQQTGGAAFNQAALGTIDVVATASPIVVPAVVLLIARVVGISWPASFVISGAAMAVVWLYALNRGWEKSLVGA